MIMSSSIGYLTSRSTFLQVSPEIPITKSRNPDKFDPPEVFEGEPVYPCSGSRPLLPALVPFPTGILSLFRSSRYHSAMLLTWPVATRFYLANKRELVDDLIVKAKQIEVLIQSLPVPEPEETQASLGSSFPFLLITRYHAPRALLFVSVQAHRLEALETAMTEANEEYLRAVDRASP